MSRLHGVSLLLGLMIGCAMIVLGAARWFYLALARAVLGTAETTNGIWDEASLVVIGVAVTAGSIVQLAVRLASHSPR